MENDVSKVCSDCKQEKRLDSFTKKKRGLYGRDSICKACYRERARINYQKNKQRENIKLPKEKFCYSCNILKPVSEWSRNKGTSDGLQSYCKDCLQVRKEIYRSKEENIMTERKQRKNYWSKQENRKRENSRRIKFQQANPTVKIAKLERSRVYLALKRQNASTNFMQDERLGCSIAEFKIWVESQFKEGMTWENHGEVWHIDHIKPLSWFDLTDKKQQKEAFHYTNQQPLWAEENLSKWNRYMG